MLRGQATNIGTSAATILGVSANGLNNTIRNLNLASGELRRVGFQYAREFSARFKRMDFERDINASRRNIRESDALFKADRYMRRNPGRYETATQRINAVDKLKQLTRPFAAKMEMYRELYGGDAELIQRAEADEAYRSHIKEVRDPIGARREALSAKFGGGSRGNILAVNAMRAEADEAYRRDMLSDYEKHFEDLTERYGGDRRKAEDKYKSELTKNLPAFFKNSKLSSKQLYNLNRTMSAFKTSWARVGAVTAVGGFIGNILDNANKKFASDLATMTAYGAPSKEFANAAASAGIQSLSDMSSRRARMMAIYGDADKGYKHFGKQLAQAKTDRDRINLAEAIGLDATDVYIAMTMAGGGPQGKVARKNMRRSFLEIQKTYGFSGAGGLGDALQSLYLSIPGITAAQAEDAENFNHVSKGIEKSFGGIINTSKEIIKVTEQSASLPSQEVASAGVFGGGTNNVSLGFTGDIIVNTDKPAEFAAEVVSEGFSQKNAARVLDVLDPKVR